jgi:hypothetical protein
MYAVGRDPRELDIHLNKNESKGRGGYSLDEESRRLIRNFNTHDMRLYEAAKERFDELKERYGSGY